MHSLAANSLEPSRQQMPLPDWATMNLQMQKLQVNLYYIASLILTIFRVLLYLGFRVLYAVHCLDTEMQKLQVPSWLVLHKSAVCCM